MPLVTLLLVPPAGLTERNVLPVTVIGKDELTALVAQLAVPNNEPVILGAISELVTSKPLLNLPEPLTSKPASGLEVPMPTFAPNGFNTNGYPKPSEGLATCM